MLRTFASRAVSATRTPINSRFAAGLRVPQTASFHASAPSQDKADEVGPGFVEKYKIAEPSRYVPLTLGVAGALTATDIYHWNEESQLLGLFILFTATVYNQAGGAIASSIDSATDALLKEQNAAEDTVIDAMVGLQEVQESFLAIQEQVKEINTEADALDAKVVAAALERNKHIARDEFVAKLDKMVRAKNEKEAQELTELIEGATAHVRATYNSDESLKSAALESALSAIADSSFKGEQTTGDLYKAYFASKA